MKRNAITAARDEARIDEAVAKVKAAVERLGIDKAAAAFMASDTTVSRWAAGATRPSSFMASRILAAKVKS